MNSVRSIIIEPSGFARFYQANIKLQSTLDISKLLGLYFAGFKLPEVQISLHFG